MRKLSEKSDSNDLRSQNRTHLDTWCAATIEKIAGGELALAVRSKENRFSFWEYDAAMELMQIL